ncbi:MAG: amino acid adenylation domain-containing protein, partial [bacterium]
MAQLVKKLELPLDMSHNSMFDAVFNFISAFGTLKSDKIAMEFVRDDEDPAIADLAFRVNKLTKSYYIELTYSEVLFNKATMEQFSRDYIALLHEIKHDPDVELSKLKIMNEADRHKLIEFNQTAADYDRSLTMVDLLTKSVSAYPDRYAVKAKDAALTYKEFDLRTNRIAHALKDKGIGREDIVAFMLPRTSDLICVIYGIMKAGAAFLPIDPEYPIGRIEHILSDSQAKYLITDKNADNLSEKIKQTIQLEELLSCQDESPIAEASPENLCYVIYTSGSTGKPKGVMIEHRNAVNFSQPLPNNLLTKAIAEEGKTALGIGTIAFDIALSEIFPALSNGLNFVLASEEEVNQADALGHLMLQEKVDVLQITPSRLIPFLDNEVFAAALKNLKLLLSAAEVFTPEMLQRLRNLTPALILNGYGPSECTIGATFAAITDDKVTIGKPISNTEIHILDRYSNEVPVGVFGELCIGGNGVGRGYYGQPELTAEKFTMWQGKRIYHTGDIAAWQRDGSISFKGRIDDLVKLHGLRIELGEIESNILKFTGIKRVLVLVREIGGSEYLCAYYQADREIDIFELRTRLAESLVYYMIPQVFTEVEEFPLTPNGKIDKKALPEPELKAEEIIAPTTEKEKAVLAVVKELLQTEEIGITNNLFNLGMTSILAIKLNVLLQKNLQLNISTNEILKNPTVKQIAALATEEANEVRIYDRRAYYPLTENQKGVYIEWEKNREALQYNVPLCLRFDKLDAEKLKAALIKVLEAHPYLKTRLKA